VPHDDGNLPYDARHGDKHKTSSHQASASGLRVFSSPHATVALIPNFSFRHLCVACRRRGLAVASAMRIYLGTGLSALLRLALLGHVCHSVSAATPWLEPELRISASSITDPDTFGCLMENADLDKVQSLDIRVGARPGRPEYIAPFDEAFAPVRVSVREYYETKLPQLAAAASELIARMPGLTAFRFVPTSPLQTRHLAKG